MSTKVLVVHDQAHRPGLQLWWKNIAQFIMPFGFIVDIAHVTRAEESFSYHRDAGVFIIEGSLVSSYPAVIYCSLRLRQQFFGPMIALSDNVGLSTWLMHAGCDHRSTRADLPDLVRELCATKELPCTQQLRILASV
jgi:hypothetical protein